MTSMHLSYTAQKFGQHWGPDLSGSHDLPVTWEELVWSAITVGKPGLSHLFNYGHYSLSDIIARTHTIYANLRQASYRIHKSDLYKSLDPTEKGATSYFVGMMVAKFIAARLLETPWLFHLSLFQVSGGQVTLNGRSQPDLIGLNSNRDWVVIEAKGRTNGFSGVTLAKAKEQTRNLRKINGQFPALRVGTHAYFSPDLRVQMDDPEEFEKGAVDLVVNERSLFNNYYSIIDPLTRDSNDVHEINGRKMRFASIDELGLTVGFDVRISKIVRDGDISELYETTLSPPQEIQTYNIDKFVVFPDGIAIKLDRRWAIENMRKQPKDRVHD